MFHHKVPLRDANGNIVKWYGSSLDVDDRKTAEEKIREQQTELRQILELAPQIIGHLRRGHYAVHPERVAGKFALLSSNP